MPDYTTSGGTIGPSGAEREAAATDARLHQMAMEALTRMYGTPAGDPQAWSQATTVSAQAPLAPQVAQAGLEQEQAKASGASAEAQTSQFALQRDKLRGALGALSQMGDENGMISPETYAAVGAQFGIDPQTLSTYKGVLTGPKATDRASALAAQMVPWQASALSGGLKPVLNADGTTSFIGVTKGGQVRDVGLPAGAQTPQVMNAQTSEGRLAVSQGQLQERIAQDQYLRAHGWTTAQIAAFRAGTTAENSTYGSAPGQSLPTVPQGGNAPTTNAIAPNEPNYTGGDAQAAAAIKAHGGNVAAAIQAAPNDAAANAIANYAARGIKNGPATDAVAAPRTSPTSYIDSLPPKGQQMARSAASQVVNLNTQLANTNKVLERADGEISAWTTGPGSLLAHLPGTQAANLEHDLDTVKANVAQAVLGAMKGANGSTGIGRVLQSEYTNFQRTLGAVDASQSPSAVRYHLGLVRQSLARMNATLNSAYQAQWHTDPYSALGQKAPQAGGGKPPAGLTLPPGFTYVGPAP